jgi:hypothetical protein
MSAMKGVIHECSHHRFRQGPFHARKRLRCRRPVQANESVRPALPVVAAAPREPRTPSEILLGIFKVVFPPLAGMALLIGIWALLASGGGSIPGPGQTWDAAKSCCSPTRSTQQRTE